jgi:toxin-antitoxin system PIN domain toxin
VSYLLDVNTLIALLWAGHEHNDRARLWLETVKNFAVCPLTELGFVRISTQPSFGVTVEQARKMLADWKAAKSPCFVPCDLEVLKTAGPKTGNKTTDYYLAALAEAHGMKLATLETNLGHRAAFSIPAQA